MGKVVRAARFEHEKYLVTIPAITVVPSNEEHVESDADETPQTDMPAPAPPEIDWEALQGDANALIDRAAQDAATLLNDAAARSRELVAQAHGRAGEIEAAARAEGHEEGIELGRAAVDVEMTEMVATLRGLVTSARDERHAIIDSAEGELVTLATSIAERVVHQHLAVEPNTVLENVRSVLTRLVSREVVTLRVHPADLAVMREHRDTLVASNDVERLRVIEDQRVDRGGVVLETESGTLDAKIGTQLREARKALHGDETIALTSSGEPPVLNAPAQAS